jgi:N-acetylmuramoyl-L-alanine amidase
VLGETAIKIVCPADVGPMPIFARAPEDVDETFHSTVLAVPGKFFSYERRGEARFMNGSWRFRTILLFIFSILLSPSALPAAWGETPRGAPPGSDRSSCNRASFRVVLDVGHTIEVPGAISARGVTEYEFNIRLARQIEGKLIDAGFAGTVLLITAGPAIEGLIKRVARANASMANLLLSIHHDSVPNFFKEEWEHEGKKNRFSDRFKGHSIFVSYDNSDRKGSLLFGKLLGNQLKARGLQYTPHYTEAIMGGRRRELVDAEAGVYKFDQLHVLRATRMPAVLLEAGSIVNRDEELLLGSPEHQSIISAAVVEAVEIFCAARSPRTQRDNH